VRQQSRFQDQAFFIYIYIYNDQGFFKHVFGQNSNKVIFFPFFFFSAAAIKISRSSLLYIYIYIYIMARTKQIKNLGVCVDFDQGSIKRTLTYN
jgi:hypothetical protein